MKIITMIPTKKRTNSTCHFCGTLKSVKYLVETTSPISGDPTQVHCCNKCCALGGNWHAITGMSQMTMHELG